MRKILTIAAVILSAAVLLAATAFAVRNLDRIFAERMAELKRSTVAALERFTGRLISYKSVSPSILQYIEVRDLAVHDPSNPTKPLLTVSSVRITYSFLTLLFSPNPADALREIKIENSIVTFDAEADKDIPKLLESVAGPGAETRSGQPIRFSGSNVELRLSMGGKTFTASNLYFTVDAGSDFLVIDVRGDLVGSLGAGFDFRTSLGVQGKVGRKLDWSDLTLKLLRFSSSLATIGGQTFQLVWKDRSLEVQRIQDRSPMDIKLLADLEKDRYTLTIVADGFKPEGLLTFSGALAAYNTWLSAPFTGSGSLTYDGKKNRLEYGGELSAVLAGQLPVQDVTAYAKFKGTEKGAAFEAASVSSAESRLEFSGDLRFPSLYPQGTLVVENFKVAEGETLNARIELKRRDGKLEASAESLELGGVGFEGFAASLSPDPSGSQRFRLAASLAGGLRPDAVKAEGTIFFADTLRVSLAAALSRIPADTLVLAASGAGRNAGLTQDLSAVISPFDVSADLSLQTDLASYSVASRSIKVTERGQPATDISFSLSADGSSLNVSDFIGLYRGNRIKGSFTGGRSAQGGLSFDAAVDFGANPYSFSGEYSAAGGIELKGSYGFSLSLGGGSRGERTLRAKAERFPIPLAPGGQTVSFALEGDFPENAAWRVTCPSLLLYDLPLLESRSNTLYLSLMLTQKEVRLSRIKLMDDFSLLEGSASIAYEFEPGPQDKGLLDGLTAAVNAELASAASESYAVHGSLAHGTADLTVAFAALPLKRIGTFALAGELTGSLQVSGPLSAPSLSVEADLRKGRLGTDPISISGRLSTTGSALEVKSLSAKYLAHTFSGSAGIMDLAAGTFTLTTRYLGDFFGDAVSSAMRLEASFKPSDWEGLVSKFLDLELQGRLSLEEVTVNAKSVPSWGLGIRTADSVLYFDGGPSDSMHGSIDSKNAFVLLLQAPLPIVGTAEGRIIGDRLQSKLTLREADLRILNAVLKSPVITVTSGTLSSGAGSLSISGPINDPDFTGSILLAGGGVSSMYAVDPAGPFSTTLSFNGKTFFFPAVTASAGKTRLTASGSFTLDHWVPVAFSVSIRTEGETVAHLSSKFGSVRLDGYASGAVKISGDERRTELTGSLLASECQITLGPAQFGKFVPEDPPTVVSLGVQTGKRVEFQWPSADYPLVRAMAKPGNSLAITYRGDTGGYTVKGAAEIQGGDVFYFDRNFILKSGKIVFDETQAGFDPRITVRAEVRERDPKSNTPVKIYLDADNKLSLFQPRFSSDPPRSDVEIMAMVGAPIVDKTSTPQWLGGTAMLALDPISQFWILRPFEQKVRTLLGIDSFSLRTQLIPNFLAQKAFGADVNPLDNTSLSLGKYIGNDLFGEIMVSLHSEDTAAGVPNINLAWEFNLEWATPLFLLNWNFAPRTPQSLFLPDNSFSLSWRFSY